MIQKVKTSGFIKGLENLKNDNLINLNFADDTLLFITVNTRMIDAVK
jgi:hypothetical protein